MRDAGPGGARGDPRRGGGAGRDVGYLALAALAVRVHGPDFTSLQRVSLAAFLALLAAVFLGVRRIAGPATRFG